ncbi:hypothetical protein JJJ17_11210 [Paracoccus caeni]|uniref:Contractile injection system tube protein N-terminal domain-containing protein n=1 Tax=Paracoccus caeni TaxID=657651 RepID=A0A934W032_9RHOB|nr:hypothetical protein [Paracoccus caeni]MBK4216495.1 hypothetical protein [Paracoccus caeni]
MTLTLATLSNASVAADPGVPVMFNPAEMTVTTNMLYPEVSVPGLSTPLLQFVRGEAKTLEAELFLDRSNSGESLTADLAKLRKYITIDSDLHAPPVCSFAWGDTTFTGVMVEFKEKFSMFDSAGKILRARVTVKLKAYAPANLQYTQINQQSPDRTKTRIARHGDRYDLIAAEEYGDPTLWTVLAEANGDDRPRLLVPGAIVEIPAL